MFAGTRHLQAELFELAVPDFTAKDCARLASELGQRSSLEGDRRDEPVVRFCSLVVEVHQALLQEARFFYPEPAELLEGAAAGNTLLLAVPKALLYGHLSADLFIGLWKASVQFIIDGTPVGPWLATTRERLSRTERHGPNPFQFAAAASGLGMPVLEWESGELQVGYGARSVVLMGSITHETAGIAVALARDKARCNALLAQAGFPVAEGGLAASLAVARKRAAALGYPVVVKPANLDGGKAVASDIRSEDELDRAYQVARAASPQVMVERHIEGRDYRLLLHREELLVAIERTPGGVTGNGTDTIATLLDRLNAEPDRSPGPETPFYTIALDGEARTMLGRQGLTADSVPSDGEFVPLRRAANFALGGKVRGVDEQIHPDNFDLAKRAMRLLRLDLAGLDLILPDIARSWRETGGAICEINAQPFIGEPIQKDYHKIILERLVQGDGRIPLVLVVGQLERSMVDKLATEILSLAVVDSDGARVDGRPISRPGISWVQACQTALFDPQVRAALCILDPAAPLPVRSPADRFTAAFLLDAGSPEGAKLPRALVTLLRRAGRYIAAPGELNSALKPAGLESRMLDKRRLEKELIDVLSASRELAKKP